MQHFVNIQRPNLAQVDSPDNYKLLAGDAHRFYYKITEQENGQIISVIRHIDVPNTMIIHLKSECKELRKCNYNAYDLHPTVIPSICLLELYGDNCQYVSAVAKIFIQSLTMRQLLESSDVYADFLKDRIPTPVETFVRNYFPHLPYSATTRKNIHNLIDTSISNFRANFN